jgi:hypothetical protein
MSLLPSSPSPLFSCPTRRGVYRAVAAIGMIALQAVDSRGVELAQLRMADACFDAEYTELLWDLLDEFDPVYSLKLLEPGDI